MKKTELTISNEVKFTYNSNDLLSFIHFLVLGLKPYDTQEYIELSVSDNSILLNVYIYRKLHISYSVNIDNIQQTLHNYGYDSDIYMEESDSIENISYNKNNIILILELLNKVNISSINIEKV